MQDILHRLPNNLPEAFDQALGRIPDRRYGDRIFQVVAVAETCLTGEQLSVALTILPGDPTWKGVRLPHSVKQVVSRCGGGLLELDEEDNQVRFIHHSVASHMENRSVGIDGRKLARSWIADAESFMGSVCVTYLNFADFDKRITLNKRLDPSSISERLKKEASNTNPLLASMIRHLKMDKRRRPAPDQLNIFMTLLEAQIPKNEAMMCFLPYASKLWVKHTAHFTEEDGAKLDVLWRALVDDTPPHVWVPWSTSPNGTEGMIDYALNESHAYLYRHIIRNHSKNDYPFIWTRQWLSEKMQSDEAKVEYLNPLIERCLVAGPSFVAAAYFLVLLTTPCEDIQFALDIGRKHLVEIEAGGVADHLWAVVEETCSAMSLHTKPKGAPIALAAALGVLVLLPNLGKSPDPTQDAAFRCLDVLSRAKLDHCFNMVWKNLSLIASWASNRQSFASLALQIAITYNNFDLVRTITTENDIVLSIIEHQLERLKANADSIIRLKTASLLDLRSHVIKEQPAVGNEGLETIRTQLMNGNYNQAIRHIRMWFGRKRSEDSSVPERGSLRRILEWVIVYRCDKALEEMSSYLSEAVNNWPTVLIDVITTYAQSERRGRVEDYWRERKIFFTFLEEIKGLSTRKIYLTGSERGPTTDSAFTALHAAALWQPYAFDAILRLQPNAAYRRTTHGLTPLTLSICGRRRRPEKRFFSIYLRKRIETLYDAVTPKGTDTPGGNPLLSLLHCSIACCPSDITRLLVGYGAKSCPVGTEDYETYTILRIIALLENRIWHGGDREQWRSQVEEFTSLEDYYPKSSIPRHGGP